MGAGDGGVMIGMLSWSPRNATQNTTRLRMPVGGYSRARSKPAFHSSRQL